MASKFLGELALRVNDFAGMTAFYRDIVGFDVFDEQDGPIFFRVAEGTEGHPSCSPCSTAAARSEETTTLDHFAFGVDLDCYEEEAQRLEGLGVNVASKEFPRFGWRLFFLDPEGNTVEFVAYDPSVKETD